MVVNSLSEIVAKTTEPVDQNADNIQIISKVLFEMASLLSQASVKGNLQPEVIQMVSWLNIQRHYFNFNYSKDKW